MQEMVASSVISRIVGATGKLNVIAKIRKYRGFHRGHHFIPMAMEVHDVFRREMDRSIKECAYHVHDRQSRDHLSLFFAFNFSDNVLILLFNVL